MSKSQLLTLRDTIVAKIAAALPGADVKGHLGRFSEAELQKFVMAAPAVRVALLALEKGQPVSDEGVDYCARIGVYVVTKDRPGLSRDEGAAVAVELILKLADRTNWGLFEHGVRKSEPAAAQNLYSDKALTAGVALWAIDLRQPVRLAEAVADQPSLKRLFVGIAPEIGAGHEADYVEVTPEISEALNV